MTGLEWSVLVYGLIGIWVSGAVRRRRARMGAEPVGVIGEAVIAVLWGPLLVLGIFIKGWRFK